MDERVLERQRHVHPREEEGDGRRRDGALVAGVEAPERGHVFRRHPPAELVPHRRVRRRHQAREHGAGVEDGASSGDGVERKRRRRDGHQAATHPDSGHVDVVQGGAARVGEQWRRLDVHRLRRRAEAEGAGEVTGAEPREAVGEGGAVRFMGLREQRQRAAAEPEQPLRRQGAAFHSLEAPEGVAGEVVAGDVEGISRERRLERGSPVGHVEETPSSLARGVGHLLAAGIATEDRREGGGLAGVEDGGGGGGAAGACGAGEPCRVVAGVQRHEHRLWRVSKADADDIVCALEDLPAGGDGGHGLAGGDGKAGEVLQAKGVVGGDVEEGVGP